MPVSTPKVLRHAMPRPNNPQRAQQGKKNVCDQHHAVAELNDGMVSRALSLQSPYATHDHVA
jgi:hypothetical protein